MIMLPKAGHGVSALGMGEKTGKVRGTTRQEEQFLQEWNQLSVSCGNTKVEFLAVVIASPLLLQTTDFKCKALIFNMKSLTLSLFKFKKAHGPARVAQQSLQWGMVSLESAEVWTLQVTLVPILCHGLVWGLLESHRGYSLADPRLTFSLGPFC